MNTIRVEKPEPKHLQSLRVSSWPIWEKEVSTFDWQYDEKEICYILEGEARIEPKDGGEAIEFGAGDLVTFPSGLRCTWKITKPVRKHYQFG